MKRPLKPPKNLRQHQPALAMIPDDLPEKYLSNAKRCPVSASCGGCQLQQLNYEGQLFVKQRYLSQLFKAYGPVQPILKADSPYYYRNKVHAVLAKDRRGRLISGMYEPGSHHVVPLSDCLIEDKRARAILNTLHQLIVSFKLPVYDEDLRQGLMRHLLIRVGKENGQILVVIVTASRTFPSKKNFVKALLKAHPEITSIVQNINRQTDNMVLGRQDEVLYGKGYILDTLCGLTFKLSPQSFYQINPQQTEKLYQKAIELADLKKDETVIDAYCGIGTIGLIASRYAGHVIGVEVNPSAIQDAKLNQAINHVANIQFKLEDAESFMCQLAAAGSKVDTVLMDPPRAGSTPRFLDALETLAPQKVIYISCQPDTLKRDLDYLTTQCHYKAERIVPCDMFPMTGHIETICRLVRVSS